MGCGRKIIDGVTGLAKAGCQKIGIKIDAAPADVALARRMACRTCLHATRSEKFSAAPNYGISTRSRCQGCGCFIAAKAMIASESCPLGWWLPAE